MDYYVAYEDLLSVIVPVYNAEKYLHRCIDSILQQSYNHLELLLIDDGSSDSSLDICEQYAEADSRVTVYHIENSGPSVARNCGLKYANGRYLAFVDADDYLETDMYSTLINEMNHNAVEMVICNWYIHNDKSHEISKIGNAKIISSNQLRTIISEDNIKCGGGYPWNRVINYEALKSAWEKPIYFRKNITIYEDKIWILEILNYINNIKIVDYVGYHYLIYKDSLCHNSCARRYIDTIKAWELMSKILGKGISKKTIEKRDNEYRNTIWMMYKNGEGRQAAEYWRDYRNLFKDVTWGRKPQNIIKSILLALNAFHNRI